MLNTVYQLKRPRQFEVAFKEMEIDDRQVIVRPTRLSICHADQRYYQGARAEEILRQKLPMALIHEGIGKVIYDPTGTFEIGTEVVMIPNRPVEKDDIIAENYLRSSKFCASSMDGFLQEYVQAVPDRFVRLPQGINPTVAAYTELVSVSFHAINRFLRFFLSRYCCNCSILKSLLSIVVRFIVPCPFQFRSERIYPVLFPDGNYPLSRI